MKEWYIIAMLHKLTYIPTGSYSDDSDMTFVGCNGDMIVPIVVG